MADDYGDVIDTGAAVDSAVAAACARMGLQQPKARAGTGPNTQVAPKHCTAAPTHKREGSISLSGPM